MIDLTKMVNKICRITNGDGDKISGRLVKIDGNYIVIRFRSGIEAFMRIDDIKFIAPINRQPQRVV